MTGALCLSNGFFPRQLEGDRDVVNRVYLRILKDSRHAEPSILDFGEISSLAENLQIFPKYSRKSEFDPHNMSPSSLRGFFDEIVQGGRCTLDRVSREREWSAQIWEAAPPRKTPRA